MSIGIQASTNKFAFLHVQDSSDEENDQCLDHSAKNNQKKCKVNSAGSNVNANKKKNRRRKKKLTSSSDTDGNPGNAVKVNPSGRVMQEWIQHDENLVDDLYNEDLKRAIELSRIEHEKFENLQKQMQHEVMNIPNDFNNSYQYDNEVMTSSSSVGKKEKKKKAVKTISLEEFRQHVEDTLPLQKDVTEEKRVAQVTEENAPNFFDEVDKQANNIKRIEEARGRFQQLHDKKKTKEKQSGVTNKRDQRLQASEEKDEIIKKLQSKVTELDEQFKHVKKRNKQLLIMLQQGEMKDKCELLLEIERLGVLRDELTEEVSHLNESLEQERSRSTKLKDELTKLQTKKSNDDHHIK
uniref:G kinase-anchoring protein 1-like n=1 Tax=Styela clava TaxID=7725 RepID=UPI00193960AF|nr:G kinase-anchoring protein 1-like [Styela clava]